MPVLAEGVETKEQLAFLAKEQCDEVQGYHFCRPIPAREFEQYLRLNLEATAEGAAA